MPDAAPAPELVPMTSLPLGELLGQLADRVPAPGGGASAALQAALAAALLAMAARYSDGARYAENQAAIQRVVTEADSLRAASLRLAEADAAAFGEVGDAYRLPRDTPQEVAARSAAITAALRGAAEPPEELVAVAARLAGLAEVLLPAGNRNLLSDVAAAAEALRAAVLTAQVNIQVNLTALSKVSAPDGNGADTTAPPRAAAVSERMREADTVAARAAAVSAAIREELSR